MSAMIGIKPKSVPQYRSNDMGRSGTLSAVADWNPGTMELSRSGAERYAKKAVKLTHCHNLDLKEV